METALSMVTVSVSAKEFGMRAQPRSERRHYRCIAIGPSDRPSHHPLGQEGTQSPTATRRRGTQDRIAQCRAGVSDARGRITSRSTRLRIAGGRVREDVDRFRKADRVTLTRPRDALSALVHLQSAGSSVPCRWSGQCFDQPIHARPLRSVGFLATLAAPIERRGRGGRKGETLVAGSGSSQLPRRCVAAAELRGNPFLEAVPKQARPVAGTPGRSQRRRPRARTPRRCGRGVARARVHRRARAVFRRSCTVGTESPQRRCPRIHATQSRRRIRDRPRQEPKPWSRLPSAPREWPQRRLPAQHDTQLDTGRRVRAGDRVRGHQLRNRARVRRWCRRGSTAVRLVRGATLQRLFPMRPNPVRRTATPHDAARQVLGEREPCHVALCAHRRGRVFGRLVRTTTRGSA